MRVKEETEKCMKGRRKEEEKQNKRNEKRKKRGKEELEKLENGGKLSRRRMDEGRSRIRNGEMKGKEEGKEK